MKNITRPSMGEMYKGVAYLYNNTRVRTTTTTDDADQRVSRSVRDRQRVING